MRLQKSKWSKTLYSQSQVQFNLYYFKLRNYCTFKKIDTLTALKYETIIFRQVPYFIGISAVNIAVYYLMAFSASYFYLIARLISFIYWRQKNDNIIDNIAFNIVFFPNPANSTPEHINEERIGLALNMTMAVSLIYLTPNVLTRFLYSRDQHAIMHDDILSLHEHNRDILYYNQNVNVQTLFNRKPSLYPLSQIVKACDAKNIKTFMQVKSRGLPSFIDLLDTIYNQATKSHLGISDDIVRNIVSFLKVDDVYSMKLNFYRGPKICGINLMFDSMHLGRKATYEYEKNYKSLFNSNTKPLIEQFNEYVSNRDNANKNHKIVDDNDIEKQLTTPKPTTQRTRLLTKV